MTLALRWVARLIALVSLTLWVPALAIAETPIPPTPRTWATDTAGLLSAQTTSDLNDRLRAYEAKTGHQVLVYIAPSTGGIPIEDWAVRVFAQWKVGRKSLDDGVVLFIFTRDRAARIEVGYGLESTVPDVVASRIIRETLAPALQAGQPDRGVTQAVDALLQRIGGESAAGGTTTGNEGEGDQITLSPIEIVLIVLVGFALLVLAVRNPWLALSLLINIVGSRGGGFSGGGGGFSGGGGRSGGGGASGSW